MSDVPQPQRDDRRTDGGAYVEGNAQIGGNFVGRDQHTHGDIVRGDKIVNINAAPAAEQPLPPSPNWRCAITTNTILTGIISFLSAILTNIATGVLPENWDPYLWLAWPLAALATSISIWLTVRHSEREDRSAAIPLSLAQRNRQAMPKRVRLYWIDGVLRKSLYGKLWLARSC